MLRCTTNFERFLFRFDVTDSNGTTTSSVANALREVPSPSSFCLVDREDGQTASGPRPLEAGARYSRRSTSQLKTPPPTPTEEAVVDTCERRARGLRSRRTQLYGGATPEGARIPRRATDKDSFRMNADSASRRNPSGGFDGPVEEGTTVVAWRKQSDLWTIARRDRSRSRSIGLLEKVFREVFKNSQLNRTLEWKFQFCNFAGRRMDLDDFDARQLRKIDEGRMFFFMETCT